MRLKSMPNHSGHFGISFGALTFSALAKEKVEYEGVGINFARYGLKRILVVSALAIELEIHSPTERCARY